VSGDVPFFLYPAYGSNSDLRGYETGSYRDRYLFTAQVELRYRVTPRNGVVGFAGIGGVADDFGQIDTTLPSVGVGYRFVIAPKNDLSMRVDVAWGRGDQEFYVGLGEAF
jgi:outer membrane translocation and assembly module TamA